MAMLAAGTETGGAETALTALETVQNYHVRSKHQLNRYALGPETLDWDAQPAPFRRFAGAEAVPLPRLCDATGQLLQALARPPRDVLHAAPIPFARGSLGALLALAVGITAWKRQGPDRWAVRANPSSGNLHPIEAYAVVTGRAVLEAGVYHYRADDHVLERRAAWNDAALTAPPRAFIALTTVMWREAWKYGERGFRYCQLDTGHALSALRYAAGILGWRLHERAALSSTALARLLGLDRSEDLSPVRRASTEQEEAELLLELELTRGSAPSSAEDLLEWSRGASFSGTASLIDAHPMYSWPVIAEVAAATRYPKARAPSDVGLPWSSYILAPGAQLSTASLVLGRRSAQRFDRSFELPRDAFEEILKGAAASLQAPARLALVLFVHRVEGLTPGVYLRLLAHDEGPISLLGQLSRKFRVEPVANADGQDELWLLATCPPRELSRMARSLHCNQDIAANCCFALGMLADLERALREPADYRDLLREAGSLGHALYLQAEAAGVRGTGIGCFFDDAVADFLSLGDTAFRTLYHFSIGKPIDDPRIETAAEPAPGAYDQPDG
jgi:SagB-type dehydrogenase family enzyme